MEKGRAQTGRHQSRRAGERSTPLSIARTYSWTIAKDCGHYLMEQLHQHTGERRSHTSRAHTLDPCPWPRRKSISPSVHLQVLAAC
ncbi:unnamed protein product [Jaminaea pallidilutea]